MQNLLRVKLFIDILLLVPSLFSGVLGTRPPAAFSEELIGQVGAATVQAKRRKREKHATFVSQSG
jgi:hypothetical protein